MSYCRKITKFNFHLIVDYNLCNYLFVDCYIITNQDADLGDVFGRLFQVSAAISDLEGIIKDREQSDASITSQTKD